MSQEITLCSCGCEEEDHGPNGSCHGGCSNDCPRFDPVVGPPSPAHADPLPGNWSGWNVRCHWAGCGFTTAQYPRKWPARLAIAKHIKAVHLHPFPGGEQGEGGDRG